MAFADTKRNHSRNRRASWLENVKVRLAYHVAVTAQRNETTRPLKKSAPRDNARLSTAASTRKPNAPTLAKRIHDPCPGISKPRLGLSLPGTFTEDRQGA